MSTQQTDSILDTINRVILGKENTVKLALSCLLAKGHLLIEDLPGQRPLPSQRSMGRVCD